MVVVPRAIFLQPVGLAALTQQSSALLCTCVMFLLDEPERNSNTLGLKLSYQPVKVIPESFASDLPTFGVQEAIALPLVLLVVSTCLRIIGKWCYVHFQRRFAGAGDGGKQSVVKKPIKDFDQDLNLG